MSSSEDDDQAAPEVGRVSNFAKRRNEAAGTQASERKSVSIDTSHDQVSFHCAFLILAVIYTCFHRHTRDGGGGWVYLEGVPKN